jgi:hypothetical protein
MGLASRPSVPFLPFVLLIAWQAISRSASFALGWATSLFFGHVPGSRGRVLSIMALLAAAWVAVVLGIGLPLGAGWLGQRIGLVDRSFSIPPIAAWALLVAILTLPALLAGLAELAGFADEPSVSRWLRRVPIGYPATASLGAAVLQMVAIAPFLTVQRIRAKRVVLQVPLVERPGSAAESVIDAVADALGDAGLGRFRRDVVTGPRSWPLRTMGFAVRHLLGAVVRGEPDRLLAHELEVMSYATNVAILGPQQQAHRARAAIERRLAFHDAYLTWSPESQELEDVLFELRGSGSPSDRVSELLDRFRVRLDATTLNADEWNVLERLRLQLAEEMHAAAPAPGERNREPAAQSVGVGGR